MRRQLLEDRRRGARGRVVSRQRRQQAAHNLPRQRLIGKVVASDVDDVLYQDEVGLEEDAVRPGLRLLPRLAVRYAVGAVSRKVHLERAQLLSREAKEFVSTMWRGKRERDCEHVSSDRVWRNRTDWCLQRDQLTAALHKRWIWRKKQDKVATELLAIQKTVGFLDDDDGSEFLMIPQRVGRWRARIHFKDRGQEHTRTRQDVKRSDDHDRW